MDTTESHEKAAGNHQDSIIKRNKQLAGCGQGVLSLTKAQKKRIQVLMGDADTNSGYSIQENSLSKLREIDTQLQEIVEETERIQEPNKRKSYSDSMKRLHVINKQLGENRSRLVQLQLDRKRDSNCEPDPRNERTETQQQESAAIASPIME